MVVAGKVRLEKLLGKGGMGSVWVATHLGLDTKVAIKFMAGSAEAALARFQREARAAAQIRSSNVVKIHDYGVDQGLPYIVMELLEGEDLAGRLRRKGRLSLAETERILIPIARGLERAHEAKLVHRDLKPENVFIVHEGDEEIPKILDFGIAKTLATDGEAKDVTEAGAMLGTPYYMSPEQARAKTYVDHRSDLWSLGVIVFRMVTGTRPYEGKALGDLIAKICIDPPPRIAMIDPTLPAELDAFFDRALAKDPEARFPSARELARAFSEIVQSAAAAGVGMNSVPPPRPFDGMFDASGGMMPMQTGRTGPLNAMGSSTFGPAMNTSYPQPAAPPRSQGAFIAIGVAALLLAGGLLAFVMLGRSPPAGARQTSSSENTNSISAAPPPPISASAAPEPPPSASVAEPEESAEPLEIETAAPEPTAAPSPHGGTGVKPAPVATEKKPARDLGY